MIGFSSAFSVSALNDLCSAALTLHIVTQEKHTKEKTYLNRGTSEERGELLAKTRDSWRKMVKQVLTEG